MDPVLSARFLSPKHSPAALCLNMVNVLGVGGAGNILRAGHVVSMLYERESPLLLYSKVICVLGRIREEMKCTPVEQRYCRKGTQRRYRYRPVGVSLSENSGLIHKLRLPPKYITYISHRCLRKWGWAILKAEKSNVLQTYT